MTTAPAIEVEVGTRTVRISNVGPLFDGEYYVTESLIVFNPLLGLQTEFGAERVAIGRP